jgi:hypothetical protein
MPRLLYECHAEAVRAVPEMPDAPTQTNRNCHGEERRDVAISWRMGFSFATGLRRHAVSRNDNLAGAFFLQSPLAL